MLVQQFRHSDKKQLLTGTRQCYIELAVDKVTIVFGKVAQLV